MQNVLHHWFKTISAESIPSSSVISISVYIWSIPLSESQRTQTKEIKRKSHLICNFFTTIERLCTHSGHQNGELDTQWTRGYLFDSILHPFFLAQCYYIHTRKAIAIGHNKIVIWDLLRLWIIKIFANKKTLLCMFDLFHWHTHTHWTGIAWILVRQSDSDVSRFSFFSIYSESTPETHILSTIGFLLYVLQLKFGVSSNCIFNVFRTCRWKYV